MKNKYENMKKRIQKICSLPSTFQKLKFPGMTPVVFTKFELKGDLCF